MTLRLWDANPCCNLLHIVSPRVTLHSGRQSAVVGWKSYTAVRVLVAVYERRIDYCRTTAAVNISPDSSVEESSLTVRQIMILNLILPPPPPAQATNARQTIRGQNHARPSPLHKTNSV